MILQFISDKLILEWGSGDVNKMLSQKNVIASDKVAARRRSDMKFEPSFAKQSHLEKFHDASYDFFRQLNESEM